MKQELKPCAHCESEATKSIYGIRCTNQKCGCAIESEMWGYDELIKRWNNRPEHSEYNLEMTQTLTAEVDWGLRAHELQIALINNGITDLNIIDNMVECFIDYQCIKSGDNRFNQLKEQSNDK